MLNELEPLALPVLIADARRSGSRYQVVALGTGRGVVISDEAATHLTRSPSPKQPGFVVDGTRIIPA
jgi:hypothetical protein